MPIKEIRWMINISTNSLIFLFAIVVFRINFVLLQQVLSLPALVCGVSLFKFESPGFIFAFKQLTQGSSAIFL